MKAAPPAALQATEAAVRTGSRVALGMECGILAFPTYYGLLFSFFGAFFHDDRRYLERVLWALTLLAIVSFWRVCFWALRKGPEDGKRISLLWGLGIAAGLLVTLAAFVCHWLALPPPWNVDPFLMSGLWFVPSSAHLALEVWLQRRRFQAELALGAIVIDDGHAGAAQHTRPLWLGALLAILLVPTTLAALAWLASTRPMPPAALWVLAVGTAGCAGSALVFGWPLIAALRRRGWLNTPALCAAAAALGVVAYPSFVHPLVAELAYRVFPSRPLQIGGDFLDLHDVFMANTRNQLGRVGAALGLAMAAAFCAGAGVTGTRAATD